MTATKASGELLQRLLGASGGCACALAVGLGAYASHAAAGQAQSWLQTASLYLFLHGLALLLLAPAARRAFMRAALVLMALGLVLFAGSLTAAAVLDWPTRLAPIGGGSLILAWLLLAFDRLRWSAER
jgi:uncharacterized membrane protein YgdD (TMEM256/DUF423 family)